MSALQKINVCKYPSIGSMLILSKDGFIITSSFHTSSTFFFNTTIPPLFLLALLPCQLLKFKVSNDFGAVVLANSHMGVPFCGAHKRCDRFKCHIMAATW